MKTAVTAKEMKRLDHHTITDMGVPSLVLMERAALEAARRLKKILKKDGELVLAVCGSGNNGGDGMALARILTLWGIPCHIYLAGNEEKMTEETKAQREMARNYQIPFVNNPDWNEYTTIVDALFGVGLSRPIQGRLAAVIQQMNMAPGKKAALDIPSGINADTGQIMGAAFQAHMTVTFAFQKKGLCFYPGRLFAGRIFVADVGIYHDEKELALPYRYLERTDLIKLPLRRSDGNKGTFGKVLIVAGSKGMCGAAYLCAAAAMRAGAGMARILTCEENRQPLQILLPEAMVDVACSEEEYQRLLSWCDVVVIGPGLGKGEVSRSRTLWFLSHADREKKPVILDADGLNLLAENPNWNVYLNSRCILTPHLGEMSRLTGLPLGRIKEDLAEAALSYVKKTGAVCVLKDAVTLVSGPGDVRYINLYGNPGMATAGSGDVLSGVLGAVVLAFFKKDQLADMEKAAAFGVLLHSLAGDRTAKNMGTRGMTAKDMVKAIPEVLGEWERKRSKKRQDRENTEGEASYEKI